MRKEGVLIGQPFPPLMNWCRLNMGSIEEVKKFGTTLGKGMS